MLTLSRVATFEVWAEMKYESMALFRFSWIYYLAFICIVALQFLNMVSVIVLETLSQEHDRMKREDGTGETGEVHRIELRTVET